MIVSSSDDRTVKLWDLNGQNLQTFRGHSHWVTSVSFSPNGQTIASASADKTVKLWDLEGNELQTLSGHHDSVRSVNFSVDGQIVASASFDTTVRLWNLNAEDLIELGCDWLQNYLVSHPEPLEELRVCHDEILLAQAAPKMVQTGEETAKGGDIKGAIEKFHTALEWNTTLDINPISRAQQYQLIGEGERFAKEGELDRAVAKFQAALELAPIFNLDPKTKALKIAAPALVKKGDILANGGRVEEAISAYIKAQRLDSNLEIPFVSWNFLCRYGSLQGHSADILDACQKAVNLVPGNGGVRDSRGLARALTGDVEGALEDFQAFVDWTSNDEAKAQRQRWIEALRAGEDPFTPEELEHLR